MKRRPLFFGSPPACESVSKLEFSAAKLPKEYSQMRSFWYGVINRLRPEGAEGPISAAPSVRNSHSDLSRRFTSGQDLSAASPLSTPVFTRARKFGEHHQGMALSL